MNQELTPKQGRIYKVIQDFIESNHRPPSLREIGRHLKLSVGTIQDQVEAIRRKGFLQKEGMIARGLRLAAGLQQVPILGRVHAGPLHMAIENVEGYLPVGSGLSPAKHFALRVRGDSMVEAGILEGDLAIVRMQAVAEEGDIVVARVDDEATVKRFRRRDGQPILEPANPQYAPIAPPFEVLGVVVEVRRRYGRH
ncbi:MAG: transcriptional repressor LexA [Elusimicrobia bacterium]|nr:transcriptional repressor LexA [Candidatus Obscuribacterium magneticum]